VTESQTADLSSVNPRPKISAKLEGYRMKEKKKDTGFGSRPHALSCCGAFISRLLLFLVFRLDESREGEGEVGRGRGEGRKMLRRGLRKRDTATVLPRFSDLAIF